MKHTRILGGTAIALIGLALAGCTPGASENESVTVRLKWFHQAQFAGYYVAAEKGYYKDAHLKVDVQPGGPDFPAVQLIAGGSEQFGVTSADQILLAREKGVPIVAVAVLYRKNPFVLFALKSSGIDSPQKLVGKTVGVKLGGNEELIYRAILQQAGVDPKSLKEYPAKFDLSPFLSKQVDVWPGYTINEVLTAQEAGNELSVINPKDFGLSYYADTLFTTEKMIQEKPEVVKAFVAATLKGWNDAVDHPDEAATASVKYGTKLTYDHELAMMKASVDLLKPDDKPIGSMDAAEWKGLEDFLIQGGFMKSVVPLDQAYTSKFLPQ